ncbi:MAG TPA: septal ring lytic transglycosylase RlpA family protein [Oligoflexia bacterium]|nr:septal ring lytic transglycosylase RlpA family protein [Oligoflexia bacterium]HMR24422.1 septal ring lytic transglycosylase RlpA family protein [Oligoflexia bacterium]
MFIKNQNPNLFKFLLLSLTLFSTACGHRPIQHIEPNAQNSQVGYASWYGPGFHGKKTASGETYNMHKLTAAHKSLPFGSEVKVKRLDTGASVNVIINDRGPFIEGRIIDVSYKAAKKLGLDQDGVSKVRMTVIKGKTEPFVDNTYPNQYWVQLGYFTVHDNAKSFLNKLKKQNISNSLSIVSAPKKRYRVCSGPFSDRALAEQELAKIKSYGHDGLVLHNPKK